jgi:sarcosine oxidase
VHDVVVIGGGAMGSAAAWALTRAGREVLLLERFGPGHDRGGSHGSTRIFRLMYAEGDYVRLAQRALRAWRDLESESGMSLLTTTGGIDHGLDERALAVRAAVLSAHGVPFEVLDPAAAGERWPGMAFDGPVVHQPDGGRLRADAAVGALQRLAVLGGTQIHHGRAATAISVLGTDAVEVRTEDGALRARHVVVSAGPWTPALLRGAVDLPPMTVTQEQPAHFAVRGLADWPSFVHWRPGASESYGLFAPCEGVKVGFHATGPVVDPDRRDFAATEDGLDALRQYVRRWLPGADPDTAEPVSCLYDNTASGDFVIDRTGPVTVATGFSGHGFKFVPVIGEMLAGLVTGSAPAPARFALAAHA